MRGGSSTSIGSVVVTIALSQLLLAADCVDGVTPDCSDAAAQCGPNVDSGGAEAEASAAPSDASAGDAEPDADLDSATDAGEE